MPGLYKKEGKPYRALRSNLRKKFPIARLAGVEWEHNGSSYLPWTNLKKWSKQWRGGVHADGSCGLESVTPPLGGDYISKCITGLGLALKKDNARMDGTCSVHVHVDAYDFTWDDMYRLLWVYSKVESELFKLAGEVRKYSHWCRPCGERYRLAVGSRFTNSRLPLPSETIQDKVLNVAYELYGVEGKSHYRFGHVLKRDSGRYKALNICPWLWAKKHNKRAATVEFRLHKNTSDKARVIKWTQLLVQVVEWSKKATDEEVQQLPNSGWNILCKIAPKSKAWITRQRAAN